MFFLKWWLLSALTGSPLLALGLLLGLGLALDQVGFGLLPRPLRWAEGWRRTLALQRLLALRPQDRRVRFELASLLERGRPRQAIELLRYNLEAGDTDPGTLLVLGRACFRVGAFDEGELFLREALRAAPTFRSGELWLALGDGRRRRKHFPEARAALERFLQERPGSVEGKFRLAQVLSALGEGEAAAARRRQAFSDFQRSPRFHRREERLWAYRAQPWRLLPWLGGLLALAALLGLGLRGASY